ncbi:MAG: aldolase/citrate lyase family protein [Sneathiella sp.]
MMKQMGRLKNKLKAGQKTAAAWMFTGSSDMAEIMGSAGFDAIMIDHEHGSGDLRSAIDQHRAIRSVGDTSIFMRIPVNDPIQVKRALDVGMEGIMFPSVNTAAEAQMAVDACRYPPRGSRGAGFGCARSTAYGKYAEEYLENFEDNVMIICQIETAEAVANIKEIAAVDGVDMLFIGPYDLSGSINKLGQFEDPEVKAQFELARDKIKASGKWLGCISSGASQSNEMYEQGFDFLLCAAETALLSAAADQLLDDLKI